MCKNTLSSYYCIKVFAISAKKKVLGIVFGFYCCHKNCHKFSGSQQLSLLSYSSVVQKSYMNFTRLKSRCQLCYFLFLRGEFIYLPYLASRRYPSSLDPALFSLKLVQLHPIDPTLVITLLSLTLPSASFFDF